MLLSNMQFEPMIIREQMKINWHCENGITENIEKIIEEYRTQRNLTVNKSSKKNIQLDFFLLFLAN